MNKHLGRLLALLLPLLLVAPAMAAAPGKLRAQHPWAGCKVGAWKKVRVITETLDRQGNVIGTSTTDTTTLLEHVGEESYILRIDTTVEVAGKKFDAPPQRIEYGFLGEGSTVLGKSAGNTSVSVEDRQIPCEVYELKSNGGSQTRTTKIFYSDKISPHVLRQETISTDAAGSSTFSEQIEEVVSLDMPHRVLEKIMPTAHIRSIRRHSKGSVCTFALHAAEVPGGTVASTAKELDLEGHVIRRSTLEVVDYGAGDQHVRHRVYKKRTRR